MWKGILGVVAGLATWVTIATGAGAIMRLLWPAYATVAEAMTFTLPMLFARLAIGALATLVAGMISGFIAPRPRLAALTTGVLLLVAFVPVHIRLWDTFPLWYHLTFLISLIPLTVAGSAIRRDVPVRPTASSEARARMPADLRASR